MTLIGTNLQNKLNTKNIARTEASMQENQRRIMTGVKAATYADMATDVSRDAAYVNEVEKTKTYLQNGQVIAKQLEYQEKTVQTLLENLIYFKEQLVGSNAAEMAKERQLGEIANKIRDVMHESLSGTIDGRFIFGGLKQDQAPIDKNDPVKLRNGTYYTGDDEVLTMHFKNLKTAVSVGITGNHNGFKEAYKAIQMIIDDPFYQPTISSAQAFLDDAIRELSDAFAELGSQQAKINDDVSLNQGLAEMLEEFLSLVRDTDQTEASTNLQRDKAMLEASFLLLQLKPKIVDFLR